MRFIALSSGMDRQSAELAEVPVRRRGERARRPRASVEGRHQVWTRLCTSIDCYSFWNENICKLNCLSAGRSIRSLTKTTRAPTSSSTPTDGYSGFRRSPSTPPAILVRAITSPTYCTIHLDMCNIYCAQITRTGRGTSRGAPSSSGAGPRPARSSTWST